MPKKRNAIAKVGYDVVSFGGDGKARNLAEQADPLDFLTRSATAPLMTVQEVAAILRCSVSSLNKWRLTGLGPKFVRVGARVRYQPRDVATFIKPGGSAQPDSRKSHARSRVSNGRDVLPNIDGRSLIARRYRDIVTAVVGDQGGTGHCSEARNAVHPTLRCRRGSRRADGKQTRVNGEEINIQEHALLCSTLVRVAQRIGIDRSRARRSCPISRTILKDARRRLSPNEQAAHHAARRDGGR